MTKRADGRPARNRHDQVARWTILVFVLASMFALVTLPVRRAVNGEGWVEVLGDILNLPLSRSVFGVVLLFLLTGALLRRKRFGLWIVIALQVLGVVYALVVAAIALSDQHSRWANAVPTSAGEQVTAYLGGVIGIGVAVILFTARSAFPARRSPGSRLATLLTLTIGMAFSITVSIGLSVALLPDARHPLVPVVRGLRAALDLDAVIPRPVGTPHLPPWAATLASTLSAIVVLAAIAVFLRSDRGRRPADDSVELTVRTLLANGRHHDSLGYFATRRDKAIVLAPDGRAAITYRVIASVSLASADPIGDPASWPAAIAAWQAEARRYGWVPAALSPGREAAQAFVDAGLRAIPLGDEAIIDAADFTMAGPAMRSVRQAVVRVRRAGYSVSIRHHRDIGPEEMARLAALAEAWRGDAPERGFSMALSRLGDPADGSCLMVVAYRPDGEPAGLLSLVPWGRRGVSLDLMRRDHDGINGLVEMMVTTLIDRRSEFGIREISLNFAMFRAVFARAEEFGAGPLTRMNNAVLGVFSRFFQLESLYRSNAKYRPSWVTRYVCVDSPLSLPRVAVAAGIAEGFLPQPGRRRTAVAKPSSPELLAGIAEVEATVAAHRSPPPPRRGEQERIRRARLAVLTASGVPGYPGSVPRTGDLTDALDQPPGAEISVAGRLEAIRDFGGVCFAVLADGGARVQLLLDRSVIGVESLMLWRHTVDRGDIVSATGTLGDSKSGERSVIVSGWVMAAKSLRPLPERRTSAADSEARVRDRSADLIVNPDSAAMIATRSRAVAALREAFRRRGYLEVETPILQNVHGGATARPFQTHINAYRRDLYLRIAPELFLKRLLVGGSGPIFEIGRNFRNEGADSTHNPEFTSLEAYLPFADYHRMREVTEQVIRETAQAVNGQVIAMRPGPDGSQVPVDLSRPWPVVPVHRAVSLACGQQVDPGTSAEVLQQICLGRAIPAPDGMTAGELVMQLYDRLVEPATASPVFYTDFPVETSPLTRVHRDDPRLSERWDLVAFGMEIGTAYSELTDPVVQRERLVEQSLRAAAGDETAMEVDEDFLSALELGMPPTGGLGLGVDRVVMMLTGSPIRGVLTFPFVRPLERDLDPA